MKTLSERLAYALKERGKSPAELARATGKTESAVSQWLSGETKSMRSDSLMAACAMLGCNAQWLASGKGDDGFKEADRLSEGLEKHFSAITDRTGEAVELSVPLLSWVRAGDFCEAPSQFSMSDAEEFLPRPLFNTSRKTFALLVRGDSMDVPGGYREGEIVYIDPDVSPTSGRDVLARTDSGTDGGMTLKRYKVDEDGPYLLQLNGNKIIRPANWHVCGVVVFSGQRR